MAKAPLKQLSVNTFESNRIISPKKNTPVIIDGQFMKKKKAVRKQSVPPVEETIIDIPSMIQTGLRMTTEEFEIFVQKTAPKSYWHIMAEHYRGKLENVTQENQQLHELVDGLNEDNNSLRALASHCEYLTDIIEKLTSEEKAEPNNKSSVCVRLF